MLQSDICAIFIKSFQTPVLFRKRSINEFAKKYAPQIAEISKSISEIPGDFLIIQQALAERGWFVLPGMPLGDYRSLRRLIDASNFNELDKEMAEWTYELFDETEADLCKLFPDREVLIREGFDNHRNDKYASAIVSRRSQLN